MIFKIYRLLFTIKDRQSTRHLSVVAEQRWRLNRNVVTALSHFITTNNVQVLLLVSDNGQLKDNAGGDTLPLIPETMKDIY